MFETAITVNRLSCSVSEYAVKQKKVLSQDKGEAKKTAHRRVWYNRRTPQSLKLIKQKLRQLYEFAESKADSGHVMLWLTLTTQQHKTGKSDKELLHNIKKFFQHRKDCTYICMVERQRDTTPSEQHTSCDIHYHIALYNESPLDIKSGGRDIVRWCELCGVDEHASMLDVKYIHDIGGLYTYIAKYIQKPTPSWEVLNRWYEKFGDKTKWPYSSIFECRTLTSSIRHKFNVEGNNKYDKIVIPAEYAKFLNLGKPKYGDYVTTYKYDQEIYKKAENLYRMLRKAGLVEDWYDNHRIIHPYADKDIRVSEKHKPK